MKYNFQKIEKKWQKKWAERNFQMWSADGGTAKRKGVKKYVLDMFPYPSGSGLHVGHLVGYIGSDIAARYYRMKGFRVLHPMGWDAFGLPAENFAIKHKIHPSIAVRKNIANFKKELNKVGFSYDWQREINTTDPEYYRWTQWIFIQLFKKGLAYKAKMPVNWCPCDKTVLANEEVIEGKCERCGSVVERKELEQWVLKITAYADRMLRDLEKLDWPEKVKEMQKNWIGRSEGALIRFPISNSQFSIEVFTTRPDTLFGATYVVLAPEHSFVASLLKVKSQKSKVKNIEEIERYVVAAKQKSGLERQEDAKQKTGVELKGIKAINPANNEKLPVWVADYVLGTVGTGAIMAVPGHDQRDFDFAAKYHLPMKIVICPHYPEKTCPVLTEAYVGEGHLVGSRKFDGMKSEDAKSAITKFVNGRKKIQYRLRDWIFSRQRYWGEPIPIVYCEREKKWIPVSEKELPVTLPKVKSYEPTGKAESPLAAIAKWVNVKCPECGGPARRETNTMPQWAGSCWYYLRYVDPHNQKKLIDAAEEKKWMPVDLYVGGVEHAVLHLLYARFWHKFLFDIGVVSLDEPFQKLVNQGLMLGPDGQKMSKSRGNVVSPEEMIREFGADSLRMYEMFMSPFGEYKPWNPQGIVGIHRFLNRLWYFVLGGTGAGEKRARIKKSSLAAEQLLHRTIKKVTEDIEGFHFNTAISAMMSFLNEVENERKNFSSSDAGALLKLLFPFAPHISQELWSMLGNKTMLDYESWSTWNPALVAKQEFDLVVQVNGKTRATILLPVGATQKDVEKVARANKGIVKHLQGKTVKKTVFVPNRLLNFVVYGIL